MTMRRLVIVAVAVAALAGAPSAGAATHTATYDHYSLKIDGKRLVCA